MVRVKTIGAEIVFMVTNILRVSIATCAKFTVATISLARRTLVQARGDPTLGFPSLALRTRVLSSHNRALLASIAEGEVRSLTELAAQRGGASPNLPRTLRTMGCDELLPFDWGPGRASVPRVSYSCFEMALLLVAIPSPTRRLVKSVRLAHSGRGIVGVT